MDLIRDWPQGGTNMSVRTKISDRARREIERAWGDVTVRDAKANMLLTILEEDFDGALTEHPAQCIFARAAERSHHSSKVLFFRRVAYVDLMDEDGVKHVERFIMGQKMREVIDMFDRGQIFIPQATFTLAAPGDTNTLEGQRAKDRLYHATRAGRAARQRKNERQQARERARRLSASEPAGSGGAGAGTDTDPASSPLPSKFARYKDDPILVDLKARSGSGVVNWLRKKKRDRLSRKPPAT
jgi:hypothetical protein